MATRILFSSAKTGLGSFKPHGEVFRKDCIRVGKWQVRNPDGDVVVLPITQERISRWASAFELFRKRGISVPLSVDHIQVKDPAGKVLLRKLTPGMAEAKRGDVVGLFRDGDLAMCDVTPADEEAKTLMNRCPEVSLEIEKDFLDAHGNYYDEAVTAVTLTPIPQIPGQKMEWEPVAAVADAGDKRLAASRAQVIYLSAEPVAEIPATDKPSQDTQEIQMDAILLARLRKITGLATEAEDAVLAKVAELAEGRDAAVETATKAGETKVLELSRSLDEAKKGTRVLTVDELAKEVDEDAMDMCASGIKARIEALGAKITPKQKTMLMSRLVGETGKRNVIALSRKTASRVGLPATLSDIVLEIFEAGDPAEQLKMLTEQSKSQRIELSRKAATDADPAAAADEAKATDRMIAIANAGIGDDGKPTFTI